jgi:hypothetical protein
MSDSTEKAYRLRIPENLYAQLEEWAREERRSVNGQIVVTLEQAVAQWKAQRKQRRVLEEEEIQTPELVEA